MAATFTGGHHKKINSKLMNTKIIQIKRNLTALSCFYTSDIIYISGTQYLLSAPRLRFHGLVTVIVANGRIKT